MVDIPKVDAISGYREFSEGESTAMKNWRTQLAKVYERHGFSPIENRPVERVEHLLLKGGLGKEIYGMCRAADGYQVPVGLPFDRTVPLAIWIARHQKETAFPFKRYDIDYSFRGESACAAANRYRGFIQADIDIVDHQMGSRIQADAEVLATTIKALDSLKIPPFVMHVNHIALAKALLRQFNVPEDNI